MTLRVALCLSGHFRSFDKTYQSLLNTIIKPYSTDVFIYSPATIGNDGSDRGDKHLMRTPVSKEKLTSLYQPKAMIIEPARSFDTSKYRGRIGSGCRDPNMIIGMYYGIYAANNLKTQYEKANRLTYDVVIRCRADLFFESGLKQEEILSCNNGIYLPKFGNYNGFNDQFAFGSSERMNTYADTYEHLDDLFDMGCIWHAESLLKASIQYSRIPIMRSDIRYYILRANGHQFKLLCDPKQGDCI